MLNWQKGSAKSKGTMEYHRTKDILYVKQVLGHKNIKNTLVYTYLIEFKNNELVTKIAKDS
jgi:site-specific recombinase XerC